MEVEKSEKFAVQSEKEIIRTHTSEKVRIKNKRKGKN